MTAAQDRIDRAFELLQGLLESDLDLRTASESSAKSFLRPGSITAEPTTKELAHRRHLEWFLLEGRADEAVSVLESLFDRYPAELAEIEPAERQALVDSHASVFAVTSTTPGEGVWLHDMGGLGEYPLLEPEASRLLQPGDMIVGRIFPVGDSMYHASRAAAFYRDETLREALRADLKRARNERRTILRLTQGELESMFFGTAVAPIARDAVAAARRLLLEGGVEREEVEDIFGDLAAESYEPLRPLPGAHDVLGLVLDRLAFDTAIDLDAAREVLLRAWSELSREGPGRGAHLEPRPAPTARRQTIDVAESIAEFEAKRRSGVPLDQLFLELEHDLALEEAEAGDEEDTPAPDFPGVVGAMLEEFFWETELEQGRDAACELEVLRSFGRFGAEIGVFENLGVRDLLAYTCYWLPESDALDNADDAKRTLAAMQKFCRWAEEKHEVALLSGFKSYLQHLNDSLPRVTEANRRRTRTSDRAQGELFECVSIDERAAACLRDKAGSEQSVEVEPSLAQWLRPGDRLRARVLPDRRVAVYCCYPPESKSLEA